MDNLWELYSTIAGWEVVSRRLDAAVPGMIAALDAEIAAGTPAQDAATRAHSRFVADVLDAPANVQYGCGDTEGRAHLTDVIREHLGGRQRCREAARGRFPLTGCYQGITWGMR